MNDTGITKSQLALRILVLSSPLLLNDFYLRLLPDDALALKLVLDVLVYIFWQGTIIYLAFQARWFSHADLGLSRGRMGRQVMEGLALLVLAGIFSLGVDMFSSILERAFHFRLESVWYYPMPRWHPLAVFCYVLYLSVTAGIFEEIVYRGIVIAQMRKITDRTWALTLASAFIFTLIHWSMGPGTWLIAFTFGAFWAWLFIRRGRLVPIMIAHFLYDFLVIYGIPGMIMKGLGFT